MVYEAPNYGTHFTAINGHIQKLVEAHQNYALFKMDPTRGQKPKVLHKLKGVPPPEAREEEEEECVREKQQSDLRARMPPRPGKAAAPTHPTQARPAPLQARSK